jgi:hypothetical protein
MISTANKLIYLLLTVAWRQGCVLFVVQSGMDFVNPLTFGIPVPFFNNFRRLCPCFVLIRLDRQEINILSCPCDIILRRYSYPSHYIKKVFLCRLRKLCHYIKQILIDNFTQYCEILKYLISM